MALSLLELDILLILEPYLDINIKENLFFLISNVKENLNPNTYRNLLKIYYYFLTWPHLTCTTRIGGAQYTIFVSR